MLKWVKYFLVRIFMKIITIIITRKYWVDVQQGIVLSHGVKGPLNFGWQSFWRYSLDKNTAVEALQTHL